MFPLGHGFGHMMPGQPWFDPAAAYMAYNWECLRRQEAVSAAAMAAAAAAQQHQVPFNKLPSQPPVCSTNGASGLPLLPSGLIHGSGNAMDLSSSPFMAMTPPGGAVSTTVAPLHHPSIQIQIPPLPQQLLTPPNSNSLPSLLSHHHLHHKSLEESALLNHHHHLHGRAEEHRSSNGSVSDRKSNDSSSSGGSSSNESSSSRSHDNNNTKKSESNGKGSERVKSAFRSVKPKDMNGGGIGPTRSSTVTSTAPSKGVWRPY